MHDPRTRAAPARTNSRRSVFTRTLCAAAALVLAAALVVGCDGSRPVPVPAPAPPPMAGPWSASLSSAGGFSGGGATTTVRSDGRVERAQWATAGTPPALAVAGTAPPELVAALFEAMRDADLRSLPAGEPANMTVTLRWDFGEEKRHWLYPEGTEPPAPIERAVTALRRAAAAAR